MASTAYFTSLDYTYPIFDDVIEIDPSISRDVLLSQTLKLPRFTRPSSPVRSSIPLFQTYHNNLQVKNTNALDDLLRDSRNKIREFMNESKQVIGEDVSKSPIFQQLEVQKPSLRVNTSDRTTKLKIINDSTSNKSTPTTNKTIYFSPSGKAVKRIATPVSVSKDFNQLLKRKSSRNLKQKLLRMDQASLVSFGRQQQPQQTVFNEPQAELGADNSDYDLLACHADNIMRMAVDSTMLGSTFNSSFSSSFSNSFANDMTGKDFFDQDAKKAILEGLNF